MTELAVMLVLRTARPLWRGRAVRALLATSMLIAVITVVLPCSPLPEPLGLVSVSDRILAVVTRTIGQARGTYDPGARQPQRCNVTRSTRREVGIVSPHERVEEIIRLIDEVLGDQSTAPAGARGLSSAATWSAEARASARADPTG